MQARWPYTIARAMSLRLRKRGKPERALRWHERWGADRMSAGERIDYAELLHEAGKSGQAAGLLTELLSGQANARAYERRAHIYNETGREEEAIADLDAAIALDPEPYLYWYTRAISHHHRGEYELAARDFLAASERREDSKASTLYELGNVYLKMGKTEEAEACYRKATERPEKAIPHFYFRLAQALERLNRLEDAAEELDKGVELQRLWRSKEDLGAADYKARTSYSPSAVATFLRGAEEEYGFLQYASKLQEALGELGAALDKTEQALRTYPDAPELLLRRGHLLRRLHRNGEAAEALGQLLRSHSQWLPAYFELSSLHRAESRPEKAVRLLEEAKERYPDHPVVRFWLADAYREAGQAELARKENERLVALEPDDPLNWKQKAEILIDGSRFREAEEAYGEAIRLERSAEFYMRRSYSRFMQERFEEAMLDVQEAVKLDESLMKTSKTAYALGELYMGMGNWELADMEFSRAIASEPENPQLYDRRARCRYSAERWQGALEDCSRALQLAGPNSRLVWLRGLIRYRQDDLEGALLDMRAYSEMEPDDPQSYFNMGRLYRQLERHDEAVESLTRALARNPFDAQAYLERASLWYHHYFDRTRATDDLAQWLLYANPESGQDEKFARLGEIRGFDDEVRERAMEQYRREFGNTKYLS